MTNSQKVNRVLISFGHGDIVRFYCTESKTEEILEKISNGRKVYLNTSTFGETPQRMTHVLNPDFIQFLQIRETVTEEFDKRWGHDRILTEKFNKRWGHDRISSRAEQAHAILEIHGVVPIKTSFFGDELHEVRRAIKNKGH